MRLSGESAKCATYNAISAGCRWSQNTRCRIPDILLHDPLSVDNQIFALEVKRAGSSPIEIDKIVDDLVALVEYTEGLNFTCGFFIGLGIDHDRFQKAARTFRLSMDSPNDDLGFDRVCHAIYACLVNDNQCRPPGGSRHFGFQPIGDFLADGGGTGPG